MAGINKTERREVSINLHTCSYTQCSHTHTVYFLLGAWIRELSLGLPEIMLIISSVRAGGPLFATVCIFDVNVYVFSTKPLLLSSKLSTLGDGSVIMFL